MRDDLRSTALVAVFALLAGWVLIGFLNQILAVLTILYFSVVLSHAVEPVVGLAEQHRIPRTVTVVAVYLSLLLAFAIVLLLIVPPLVLQAVALIQSIPNVLYNLELSLQSARLLAAQSEAAALFEAGLTRLGQELVGLSNAFLLVPLRLSEIVIILVTIPILSFYWLIDSVRIESVFLSLLPEPRRDDAQAILSEMAVKTGAFIRGQVIAMITVGLLCYIGLLILGVNYALMLGVIAGLLEVIPFIGPPVSAIPAIIVALLQSPILAGEVVILYVVVQQIESNAIIPNVMKREVGLHPLVVILALLIGGMILGLPGAILAIPVSASLQVLFERVVFPWVRSWRW
ncbi:MAG: AI-2E family transporter [Chloroflexi bacterium]|nr:AI-2E family transporter [Chloroflexota bacterium]